MIMSEPRARRLNSEVDLKGEYSDRGRYVTSQVALWLANDSAHFYIARRTLKVEGLGGLRRYALSVLLTGRAYSAPWHVMQELAPNDLDRVNWEDVAANVKEED
jgi:hypothetical protein